MEGIGSFLDDEEWDSLSKLLSIEEDSDNFMLHLNGNSLFPSAAADYNESNLFIPSHTLDYISNSTSQESSNSSEIGSALFSNKSKENHLANGANFHHDHTNNSLDQSMNFYAMDRENGTSTMPVFPDDVMGEIFQLKGELCEGQKGNAKIHPSETDDSCKEVQLKRKYKTSGAQTRQDKSEDHSSASPKKKPRVSRDVSKNKRNVRSKKMKKSDQNISNEEENNSRGIANSSSTSTSEDDFINDSEELNSKEETIASRGSQLNSNGKERASRGSANDPQSLYARKRRERINERLKILQNLIPNGTKVDISTMLEEAVHYVKFLQLQIKLLSSDDHWMYSPIAYSGMDMGFYQKIVSNLCIQN